MSTNAGSNDMHPDHDMAEGEKFIKDVYEALRGGPAWNDTLFIVTFDEHGGFYDHVGPPGVGVPAPDGIPPFPDRDAAHLAVDREGHRDWGAARSAEADADVAV